MYPLHILIPFFITHHLPHPTLMNMRHSRLQIRVTHSPSTVTEISAASLIQLPSFMMAAQPALPAECSHFVLLVGTNGLIHMQAHTQNSRRALICIHIDMYRDVFMLPSPFRRWKGNRKWLRKDTETHPPPGSKKTLNSLSKRQSLVGK